MSGVDILPTIADLCGSDLALGDIDGGSMKPLIYTQGDTVDRPNGFLVFHDKSASPKTSDVNGDSESALMRGGYKLIKTWKDGAPHTAELYDLRSDPGEADDLADRMPELAAELGRLLDDYIARSGGDVTIDDDDWPPKRKKS